MALWSLVTWQSVLGTAAAALGAAILVANSPLAVPKREPFSLAGLRGAVLTALDGSGREVKAEELWRERGAVIMVVRRPG
ncbi:Peroxiredoxin-like 2A [Geodia barretti]|uniref:Peroxiredoxin-like 2A n=1 Tax=Geodia barretti TaxID=519541 RepID=A0AA35SXQ2_GEOBA|nr:Peroxiredoxin-like 2A [Geodia barretti]